MKNIALPFAALAVLLALSFAPLSAGEDDSGAPFASIEGASALWESGNWTEALSVLRALCNSAEVRREEREAFVNRLLAYAGMADASAAAYSASGDVARAAASSEEARSARLEAAKILEILADELENKTEARKRLAAVYRALGKRAEARRVFKTLLSQEGLSEADRAEFEAAVESLKKEIEKAGEEEYKIPEQAKQLVQEGKKFFSSGEYGRAIERFSSALYLAARYADARILAGHAYYAEGFSYRVESLKQLAMSDKLPAGSVESAVALRRFRSLLAKANGDFSRAISTIEPLLEAGKNAEAWIIAGKCQIFLNHPREAGECLKAALLTGSLRVEEAEYARSILERLRAYDLSRPGPKDDKRIEPKKPAAEEE